MRQIEEIKKLTGGRHLVRLADGTSFPLYAKELEVYNIHEDGVLSEESCCEILETILPKRAKLCAMNLLKQMDRTEHQLRTRLIQLGYPDEIVQDTVLYVKRFRYIDDLRYAVNYMEYRRESRSIRQLEQELHQKGIGKDVFEEALAQIEAPDEEAQIRSLMRKKQFRPEEADRKETERMYRFLLRRGYSISAVTHALKTSDLCE